MKRTPDYLSDVVASKRLVAAINRYWRRRGYHNVSVWTEQEEISGSKKPLIVVRSNIKQTVPR